MVLCKGGLYVKKNYINSDDNFALGLFGILFGGC